MKTTQMSVPGLLVALRQRDDALQVQKRLLQQDMDRLDEKIAENLRDIKKVEILIGHRDPR